MKLIKFALIIICVFTLFSCSCEENSTQDVEIGSPNTALGDENTTFGEDISEEIYGGYFENEGTDITVTCVSGTPNAYTSENNVLTFTALTQDSVYSVSGNLKGSVVIDVGSEYKLDLELCGFSLISENANPVSVLSGNKVTITAKKGYESYIYDEREKITDESQFSGAIYSLCDLEIAGKGSLTVVSKNNNGIHSKDDLEVKNLTLTVTCKDNALKGNDSVSITGGNLTIIATQGDGIKTTNSDVSEKGNQRGTVTITGGEHSIYAACDGIDAAYNVEINDESTILNIYTDKYSNYSEEVTAVSDSVYYIRFGSSSYKYSVKYYNSDSDFEWVNAEYHSSVSGGRSNYYYYSFAKKAGYSKIKIYMYTSAMEQGQEGEYYVCTDYLTPSTTYDTFAISSRGGSLGYSWTNYTTTVGGGGFGGHGGGMNEGNTDKGDHSTKGIKACNQIIINNGKISIKAYDDAIHANNDVALENGEVPLGNVTVNGGNITVYSNDDGLHADGTVTVKGGTVMVSNSYEGVEGTYIKIQGGALSVYSRDDGINGTAASGTAVAISGGTTYIYCSGDGIDSNSRTSYSGLVFSGGKTVVISNSNGNSAIDTEQGYKYTGGKVVAIMPSGGMTSESTNCSNFSSIGSSESISLSASEYLTVEADGDEAAVIKMPCSISGEVIYLGSSDVDLSTDDTTDANLNINGVAWK